MFEPKRGQVTTEYWETSNGSRHASYEAAIHFEAFQTLADIICAGWGEDAEFNTDDATNAIIDCRDKVREVFDALDALDKDEASLRGAD